MTDRRAIEVFIAVLLVISPPFFIYLGYFMVVGLGFWLMVYIPFLIWGELPFLIRLAVFALAYWIFSSLYT